MGEGPRLLPAATVEAVRRVASRNGVRAYTSAGRDAFLADGKTQDAVIRNIEVLGEATKNLSPEIRDANPDIPWKRIAGMRDRVIHA